MISIKSHLLTKDVKDNLIAVSNLYILVGQRRFCRLRTESFIVSRFCVIQAVRAGQGGQSKVSFPYFMAFNSLLNNMELIKRIYLNATNGHRYQEVTKGRSVLKKKIYI